MESFTQVISQHIPWFWGFLAWSLAILILLSIAAILAYLILYPITAKVRREIGHYLFRLVSQHATERENRRKLLDALVEDFKCDSGISFVSERLKRLEGALLSFSKVLSGLKPQLDRIVDLPQDFKRIGERLTEAASKAVPVFPALPAADEISAQDAGVRTAWVRLAVSSVILVALIIVNTGMLGQILRDLGVVPHDLAFFGIPLYRLLAFMLTLIEAGVGYVHTATRPAADEPSRVAVWPAIAVCFAAVIACVEGFFYSQVAPRDTLVDLPFGYQAKQATLFFFWGAVLVSVLFALGVVWGTSLERITSSPNYFSARVRGLARFGEKFATASESAAKSAGHLKEKVEGAGQQLQSAVQQTDSLVASALRMKESASGSEIELDTPRGLTTAEAYHFIHLSGLWTFLALLLAIMVTASGVYGVGYTFPYLAPAAGWLVSIGLAAYFVVIGLLVPRDELLLEGTGSRRLIVSGSLWRGKVVLALAIAIVATFILLTWRVGMAGYQAVFWLVILVLGGALTGAAGQAAAMGRGLRLWLRLCANQLRSFVEAVVRLLLRFIYAGAYCAEVLVLALAAPIFILRGHELPPLQVVVDT